MAGSLSLSCFAKKKVVQGWPVTLFCLMVDKVLYHPFPERMFSQRCRNRLMLQSLNPGNKLNPQEVCRCRLPFLPRIPNFQLVHKT